MDWLTFISSIVVAALTGTIASLLAPWSQWGVEKRKVKNQRRQALVDSWYKLVEDYQNNDIDIVDHKNYNSLRRFLSEAAITEFEVEKIGAPIVISVGRKGVSADRKLRVLLAEIKRIEDDWGLM